MNFHDGCSLKERSSSVSFKQLVILAIIRLVDDVIRLSSKLIDKKHKKQPPA